MVDSLKTLGNNQISVSQIAYGYQFIPNVIVNNSYTLSSTKIVMSGMPLSLFESDNGRYFLSIILETGATVTNSNYFIFGEAFYNFGTRNDKNIMLVSVKNGLNEYYDSLVYGGIPLSINSNNYLIVSRYIPTEVADDEGQTFIGGIPLLIKRYGNNWFLVAQSI